MKKPFPLRNFLIISLCLTISSYLKADDLEEGEYDYDSNYYYKWANPSDINIPNFNLTHFKLF